MAKDEPDFLAIPGRVMEVLGMSTDVGAIGHTLKSNVPTAADVRGNALLLQQVAKLRLFCRQISRVVRIRGGTNRKLFDDFKLISLQPDDFPRIVG